VLEAVSVAAGRGLRLPIVYNSSGYDVVGTLRLLDGVVDVYMPDFKFWRTETAERYARAPDYPGRARAALLEMHRQVGPLRFGPGGLARRGVLVRHLVMPGLVEESKAIFEWIAREVSPDTYLNLMGQYRPEWKVGEPDGRGGLLFAEIDRRPRPGEMEAAHASACRAGLWRFDERNADSPGAWC
jgi:putative pyruvate formate lyase activating enzyme